MTQNKIRTGPDGRRDYTLEEIHENNRRWTVLKKSDKPLIHPCHDNWVDRAKIKGK